MKDDGADELTSPETTSKNLFRYLISEENRIVKISGKLPRGQFRQKDATEQTQFWLRGF